MLVLKKKSFCDKNKVFWFKLIEFQKFVRFYLSVYFEKCIARKNGIVCRSCRSGLTQILGIEIGSINDRGFWSREGRREAFDIFAVSPT